MKWKLSDAKWGVGDQDNLADALRIIDMLLSTTELNMDDMEPETRIAIQAAANFQAAASQHGYQTTEFPDDDGLEEGFVQFINGCDYTVADVLADAELREELHSDWLEDA